MTNLFRDVPAAIRLEFHDLLDGFLEPDPGGEARPSRGCGDRVVPGEQPGGGIRGYSRIRYSAGLRISLHFSFGDVFCFL